MEPDAKALGDANVVFIDTNLDTHLALLVSHLDTVSDLRKRIQLEHPSCFPKIGQIQIHAIKVKRQGHFYHLSDSMFVRSAFNGFNKSWFLSVDASALGEHGQNELSFSPGSPNQVACLDNANNALIGSFDPLSCLSKRACNVNDFHLSQLENKQNEKEETPPVGPCVSVRTGKEAVKNLETGVKSSGNNDHVFPLPGSIPGTQHIECEVDGSSKGIKDDSNVCEERNLESVPNAKKKQKSKRKKEDKVRYDTSKENNAVGLGNDRLQQDILVPENPSDNEFQIMHRIPLPSGSIPETQDHCQVNNELPSLHIECKVDGCSKYIKDDSNVCEEGTLTSVTSEKKKRKSKRKKEDKEQEGTSRENNASVVGLSKDTVQQEIVVPENSSENADKEVSYEISVRENNMADGICWDSSSNTHKRSSSRIPMSNEVSKETEVLKEHQHTECGNNDTKNDIDAECNESMKDALEPGPAANKKHKKRKRSLTHDSKEEMLKVEMASLKDEAQKSDEGGKQGKELKNRVEINNDKSRNEVESQHNKVTEKALDTRPPAKKKLKRKDKSGDESSFREKQSMMSDSNAENASQHFLQDQQNVKDSGADQSTEHFNNTGLLKTSVLGGRRKGKKNSSNPHQTSGVTSSTKDDETDHSRIQAVQEEVSEDGLVSKDISMNITPPDNMEIRTDGCKEGILSKVKGTENPENSCAVDMKVHPSVVNEPKELSEDNENIVLDHCHKSEARQIEGTEEGREISPQNDPQPMLSEKCVPSSQDNLDVNIRELTVTSKVLDVNGIIEPVKSEKKRKERRKAKDSDGGPTLREGIGLVDTSESKTIIIKSLEATNGDSTSRCTETEENPVNQTEGRNVQPEEMKGTFLSASDADNAGSLEQTKSEANAVHTDKRQRNKSNNKRNSREDDINADDAGSLEQIKIQADAEHVDKRQRKKSNNKQTSNANSIPYMLTKDQVLDCKSPSPSSDSRRLVEPSFKITKKNKSASTKSTNESNATNLEADDVAKDTTRSSGDQGDNNLEAPSKTDKNNADQQIASLQQQHQANLSDGILGDKMNGADRTDFNSMTGKNTHRLEATKGQTQAESLSSTQRLLSEEEDVLLGIHPDKMVPNVHRTGQEAKLSSLSNSITSSIEAKRKPHVKTSVKSMDLEKRRKHFPISNSKQEGSKKIVQNKAGKAPRNNIGGVVSNTWQKKSLLTGAIFKDGSSGTSEDEDDVDNSDASTRTPSDNSNLSDYSDGESSAGSYGAKKLENGGGNAKKGGLSGTKGMSIDHILRSSSRYKKAKITASQLEETESQQVHFVPDSLADTY